MHTHTDLISITIFLTSPEAVVVGVESESCGVLALFPVKVDCICSTLDYRPPLRTVEQTHGPANARLVRNLCVIFRPALPLSILKSLLTV